MRQFRAQSAFQIQSAVYILYLVYISTPICNLQSVFYANRNAEHPYLTGDALLILLKFTKLSIEKQKLLQVSHDHRSFERNLSNCEQKPEKIRTSTRFEPVTSRYRCDALTN